MAPDFATAECPLQPWSGLFRRALSGGGALIAVSVALAAAAPQQQPTTASGTTFTKPLPGKELRVAGAFRKNVPTSISDLQAIESRVEALIKKVSPAVVSVSVMGAAGSGAVISPDGLVLTAAHVSGMPNRRVEFHFPDGRVARGITLGTDREMDAGLMRITDPGPWPYVPVGKLENAGLGDWVVALGHPGGFDAKRPVVARLGRIIVMTPSLIQTDCTLLSGDSGGPLFDISGRVIGIHSGISDSASENYHVPITTFLDTWERLADGEDWGGGRGRQGFVGLRASTHPDGILLESVSRGGRAARAGLMDGDIVTAFNGEPLSDADALIRRIEDTPGRFTLTVRRGDETLDLAYAPGSGRGGGRRFPRSSP